MQKKNFLYIGIPIVIIGIYFIFPIITSDDEAILPESFPDLDFTYVDANLKLKERLVSEGISMSSPIKLSKIKDIEKYCSFFAEETMQDLIDYCTSTELRDSNKKFLGNIHIVGSKNLPKVVLVVLQTDPFMQNLDEIKSVYNVAIENLVCNCWEEVKPGEIASIDKWVDAQKDFHTSDVKPTSQSYLNLMGKRLEMELTTNAQGYLWKLLISG